MNVQKGEQDRTGVRKLDRRQEVRTGDVEIDWTSQLSQSRLRNWGSETPLCANSQANRLEAGQLYLMCGMTSRDLDLKLMWRILKRLGGLIQIKV
jgi:hypothetical protein